MDEKLRPPTVYRLSFLISNLRILFSESCGWYANISTNTGSISMVLRKRDISIYNNINIASSLVIYTWLFKVPKKVIKDSVYLKLWENK